MLHSSGGLRNGGARRCHRRSRSSTPADPERATHQSSHRQHQRHGQCRSTPARAGRVRASRARPARRPRYSTACVSRRAVGVEDHRLGGRQRVRRRLEDEAVFRAAPETPGAGASCVTARAVPGPSRPAPRCRALRSRPAATPLRAGRCDHAPKTLSCAPCATEAASPARELVEESRARLRVVTAGYRATARDGSTTSGPSLRTGVFMVRSLRRAAAVGSTIQPSRSNVATRARQGYALASMRRCPLHRRPPLCSRTSAHPIVSRYFCRTQWAIVGGIRA